MSSSLLGCYMVSEEEIEEAASGGVVEDHQHDAAHSNAKVGHVDMDKSNPWFTDGYFEIFSIERPVPKRIGSYLQEVWPTVSSALDENDIKCALDLEKGIVTLSTFKIPDLDNILKARQLFQLLELDVPACQAITVLKKGGMCSELGLLMEQFVGQDNKLKHSKVDHMEVEKACTSLNEVIDARVNEVITVNRRISKNTKARIKKAMPMVKSAIEEYCFPCKLTMWDNFMSIATTRIADLDSIVLVRELLLLLSLQVPVDQAITVLTRQWLIIMTNFKGGLCKQFGIKKEQFDERNNLIIASSKELGKITGCDIFISEAYVIGIGPSKGLKLFQRIVKDCIIHNVPPASRIRAVKKTLKTMRKFEGLRLCD